MTVTIEDFGPGDANLQITDSYSQTVSPGGVSVLAISDGIRLLEPPPYTAADEPTVQATIKNVSATNQVLDRLQCVIDFVDSGGFSYQRFCIAENFDPTVTLPPGGTYTYTKTVDSPLGGATTGYIGTVTILAKFDNVPGQDPITNAEAGATAQFSFEKDHTIMIVNGIVSSSNPVDSGATLIFSSTGVDSMNHPEYFTWSSSCPTLSSNGIFVDTGMPWRPEWIAPTNTTGESQACTITLTVNDDYGLSTTDTLLQTVNSIAHTLEIVTPASGSPSPVSSGEVVGFSVTAHDSFEHTLSYHWSTSCDGIGDGTWIDASIRTPAWVAPLNNTGVVVPCTMTVMVSDGAGLRQSSSVEVSVNSIAHVLSFLSEPTSAATQVTGGSVVQVSTLGTDSFEHAITYSWEASCDASVPNDGTFSDDTVPAPLWTAPVKETSGSATCVLSVTIEDGTGLSEQGSVPLTVTPTVLFGDDFESGDLSAWSGVVP